MLIKKKKRSWLIFFFFLPWFASFWWAVALLQSRRARRLHPATPAERRRDCGTVSISWQTENQTVKRSILSSEHITWFLMPSSSASFVVLSWKTRNWKIRPFVPTAWTVIGRSSRCCGWVWGHQRWERKHQRKRRVTAVLAASAEGQPSHRPGLPHRAYERVPRHFQTRTSASWLWTAPVAAYSDPPLPPGKTACGGEGTGSPLRSLTTWHRDVTWALNQPVVPCPHVLVLTCRIGRFLVNLHFLQIDGWRNWVEGL